MIEEIALGMIIVISTLLIWFIISTFINLIGMPIIILIIAIVLSFTTLAYFFKKRKYK